MKKRFKAPRETNADRVGELLDELGIAKTVYIQPTVSGELSAAHFEIITQRMYVAFTTARDMEEVPEKLFTWTCQLVGEALQLTALMFKEGKRVTQSEDFLRSFRKQHSECNTATLKARCHELRHDLKILVLQFTGEHYARKVRMFALYSVWTTLFQIFDLETLILERHYGIETTPHIAESVGT